MKIVKHDEQPQTPVSHDPDILKKVILSSGDADNLTQASTVSLKPGQSTTSHIHSDMTEIYTLTAGLIDFEVNGEAHSVSAPATVVIHPGETHSIKNSSDSGAELSYVGILSAKATA